MSAGNNIRGDQWIDMLNSNDMSDPLANLEAALDQMLSAVDDGRYRTEAVHLDADFRYLRAEVRRARRVVAS